MGLDVVVRCQPNGLAPEIGRLVEAAIGFIGLTFLFGNRAEVMVNHGDVVEGLGHLAVELQGLGVLVEGLLMFAIAGIHQGHVVEDEGPVIGVVLKRQGFLVVLEGFGVLAIGLGAHAVAVIGKRFLGAPVGGQHLEDQVGHHREALVDEVVVALGAGHRR